MTLSAALTPGDRPDWSLPGDAVGEGDERAADTTAATLSLRTFCCRNDGPHTRRSLRLLAAVERVREGVALAHEPLDRGGVGPRDRRADRRSHRRAAGAADRGLVARRCVDPDRDEHERVEVGDEQAVGDRVEHALADAELGGAPGDR